MSKRLLAVLAVASLVAVAGSVAVAVAVAKNNDDDDFRARLTGFQEVPAVSTTGRGNFRAEINGDTISYRLSYSGLEGTAAAAHIHLGQKDVNGGVIAFLCGGGGKPACPPSGTVTGTITAADIGTGAAAQGITTGEFAETVRAIRAGVVYANVHTNLFPNGEIRGQVRGD